MASNSLAFSQKDRIDHSVYGLGTVVDVNERHTTILFDEAGSKKFMTTMVKLVRSNTLAPTKRVRRKNKVVSN